MRILFILEYYYPHIGGVETFFKTLVEHLDSLGHEVVILTNQYDASLPSEENVGRSIKIIRNRYYNRYGFTFLAWKAAIKYAKAADIIHTTSYNAAVPAWIAAKWTGTKSIITFHERWGKLWFQLPWMSYPSKVIHFAFEKMITSLGFDRFVGVSDYTKNALIEAGIPAKKVQRIYNGIDYESIQSGLKPIRKVPPFTFLFFGRVGVAKGLNLLINAYHVLCQERTDHQLVMVLPSEQNGYAKRALKLIRSYNLDNYIYIKHDLPFDDLVTVIANADAVVIPSYSEGFCFAAVETMAIGTPIISSGKGALQEVVSGQHITLQEYTAGHLAKAMKNALNGNWEERTIRQFPIETTINEYLNLYQEVLD